MIYDLLVTAVSERSDLFARSMASLLASVDIQPNRIIVHEDVRPGSSPGEIAAWLSTCGLPFEHRVTSPARGMGPGMLWCFEQATTPIVLYTQEDWGFVRPAPIARCLDIMEANRLHHVRFNKRKTMVAKHADTPNPWAKVEVRYLDSRGVPQTFCVSDHWYTQASLWRVDVALSGLRAAQAHAGSSERFVASFNAHMNTTHGDPARAWNDQAMRDERLRTYIWGPVAEPRFIEHIGSQRGTGAIVYHLVPKGSP